MFILCCNTFKFTDLWISFALWDFIFQCQPKWSAGKKVSAITDCCCLECHTETFYWAL